MTTRSLTTRQPGIAAASVFLPSRRNGMLELSQNQGAFAVLVLVVVVAVDRCRPASPPARTS